MTPSDLTISEEELEGVRHHLREHGWGEIGDEICALARRSLVLWQLISEVFKGEKLWLSESELDCWKAEIIEKRARGGRLNDGVIVLTLDEADTLIALARLGKE